MKHTKQKIEASILKTYLSVFYEGTEEVTKFVVKRFFSEENKENYNQESKRIFIKAAQEVFSGKTNIDSITILELKEFFTKNEMILSILKEFSNEESMRITFQEKYTNNEILAWFRGFLEHSDKDKKCLKKMIEKRFINKNKEKNLSLEDRKKCLEYLKSIIEGRQKLSLVDENDIEQFDKIFTRDNFELHHSFEMDLIGQESEDCSYTKCLITVKYM